MFKIALSPTFWQTVKFDVQGEEGGRVTGAFDLQFKRLTMEEVKALMDRIAEDKADDETFLREVVVGWRGVAGPDGDELTFSGDAFHQLCNMGMTTPILAAFYQALPKAKAKN
jgi:hypothetical protein